jgi:tyrosinase
MNRRNFIQLSGLAMLPLQASAQAPSSAAALRTRRSALLLPPNDPVFAKYAEAVRKMHELPKSDPRSWWSQATIHPEHCPHGTIGFLPWHRHYITFFERICGELIGDPTFALPYWDWSIQRGKLPDPFYDLPYLNVEYWKDPGVYKSSNWGRVNSLPARGIGKGVGVQDDPQRGGAFIASNIRSILNETDYSRFTGRIETSPHNTGHVRVGVLPSGKSGHMVDGLSPLDPIFWLHHCNIDRLWAEWQTARNMTPNFGLTYDTDFVDAKGKAVSVTADGAKDFVSLDFTYDTLGDPRVLAVNAKLVSDSKPWTGALFSRLQPLEIGSKPKVIGASNERMAAAIEVATTVGVAVNDLKAAMQAERTVLETSLPALESRLRNELTAAMTEDFGKSQKQLRRIFARVKGVTGTFSQDPMVNVFVNCKYLTPDTPYTDKHYAGTFAFFGAKKAATNGEHEHQEENHHGHSRDIDIDLTDAIRELDLGELDKIDVQFMVLGLDGGAAMEGELKFDAVEILSV